MFGLSLIENGLQLVVADYHDGRLHHLCTVWLGDALPFYPVPDAEVVQCFFQFACIAQVLQEKNLPCVADNTLNILLVFHN